MNFNVIMTGIIIYLGFCTCVCGAVSVHAYKTGSWILATLMAVPAAIQCVTALLIIKEMRRP